MTMEKGCWRKRPNIYLGLHSKQEFVDNNNSEENNIDNLTLNQALVLIQKEICVKPTGENILNKNVNSSSVDGSSSVV